MVCPALFPYGCEWKSFWHTTVSPGDRFIFPLDPPWVTLSLLMTASGMHLFWMKIALCVCVCVCVDSYGWTTEGG